MKNSFRIKEAEELIENDFSYFSYITGSKIKYI